MESEFPVEEVEEDSQEAQDLEEVPIHHLEESYDTVAIPSPSNSQNIVVRGKYYKQTYRPAWEQMPDFKGWLRGVVGQPTRAYCTYCQKTLHAHRLSLLKHTCTIRHQKASQIHNSRKHKSLTMEAQGIHTLVLQEDDLNQTGLENEDGEAVEYAEAVSETENEDHASKDNSTHESIEDEEEDELTVEMQNSFEKQPTYQVNQMMKPPVSTHVIDSTRGVAVFGLQVCLYKLVDGRWTYMNEGVTNVNGRFNNFIDRSDFTPGRYKLHLDVDRYFENRKQESMYPFIEIIFDCKSVNESYHIPVCLSPYGYSTYRGS